MNWKTLLLTVVCVTSSLACGSGQEPANQPPQPTGLSAGPAATAPARPAVAATVGAAKILNEQIDAMLKDMPANLPPQHVAAVRNRVLTQMIFGELLHAYVEAKQVACDPNEMAQIKQQVAAQAAQRQQTPAEWMKAGGLTEESLRDRARINTLTDQIAGKGQVDALVKDHPSYFNGTKVQASHILIACTPTAPSKDQKAAVAKLDKFKADIAAGTTTFEEAAKAHSACPSGQRAGGDLGEFVFHKMVPPFSLRAFEMKVGEVSDVVRTEFGFHIIKVTKRTEGTDEPDPNAPKIARRVLTSQLESRIFDQALTTCPIVIAP